MAKPTIIDERNKEKLIAPTENSTSWTFMQKSRSKVDREINEIKGYITVN